MKQCNQQLKSFTQMLRYTESKVPHIDAGNNSSKTLAIIYLDYKV
jgi:hypothetical protein